MSTGWFSYDDVAEAYGSAAEPAYFTAPAEELISLLQLRPGARLLDVGAGSGAATAAAVRTVARGRFVACDSSMPMLLVARRKITVLRAVAAELPHLPFAKGAYDAAALGFVLSHLVQPIAALREIQRVVAAGGRVGVSSWASSPALSPAGELWQAFAEEHVEAAEVSAAVAHVVPSETQLSTPEGLLATLSAAGFHSVAVQSRQYSVRISVHQFIQSRILSASSRFMRARLTAAEWNHFISSVSQAIADQFGEQLSFSVSANLAVANLAG